MDKKIRILQVGLDNHLGGIETYLLKIATNLDKEKYHFSFLTYKGIEPCFKKELEDLGCDFFEITHRRNNPVKFVTEFKTLLKRENFDIVHFNMNSLSYFELILVGVDCEKNVIVHSRNASNLGSTKTRFMNKLGQIMIPKQKIKCVAVSDLAGEWMFGKATNFITLNNGLDVGRYRYDEESRSKIRAEFGLNEQEVIIHVGAFRPQKNHEQLIDIFKAYHDKHHSTVLMLVGDGDLKCEIEHKVKKLGIEENVIFTGNRNDIPELLSAADKFLLPSIYEGFPNALIEAEASGLYCVISDTITKQAMLGNLSKSVNLDASMSEWTTVLEGGHQYVRTEGVGIVRNAGLDIDGEMKKLYEVYDSFFK